LIWTSCPSLAKLWSCADGFTQTATPETIAKHFELPEIPLFAKPNYNVSPSHKVAAIRLQSELAKREAVLFRWGLIPPWAKDKKISF
jgi:putative SOS response-associated peptidase YedK